MVRRSHSRSSSAKNSVPNKSSDTLVLANKNVSSIKKQQEITRNKYFKSKILYFKSILKIISSCFGKSTYIDRLLTSN